MRRNARKWRCKSSCVIGEVYSITQIPRNKINTGNDCRNAFPKPNIFSTLMRLQSSKRKVFEDIPPFYEKLYMKRLYKIPSHISEEGGRKSPSSPNLRKLLPVQEYFLGKKSRNLLASSGKIGLLGERICCCCCCYCCCFMLFGNARKTLVLPSTRKRCFWHFAREFWKSNIFSGVCLRSENSWRASFQTHREISKNVWAWVCVYCMCVCISALAKWNIFT